MEKETLDIYVRVRGGRRFEFCGLINGDEERPLFGGGDHDVCDVNDFSEQGIIDAIFDYCENDYEVSVAKMCSPDKYQIVIHDVK